MESKCQAVANALGDSCQAMEVIVPVCLAFALTAGGPAGATLLGACEAAGGLGQRETVTRALRLEAGREREATFAKYGVYYTAAMRAFFKSVLY